MLRGHPAGLPPRSPGSLADDLLLLLRSVEIREYRPVDQSLRSHLYSLSVDPVGFEPTASSMPLRRAPSCAMGPSHPVDLEGFEPSTSSVRLRRAPNCATGPCLRVKRLYLRGNGMSRRMSFSRQAFTRKGFVFDQAEINDFKVHFLDASHPSKFPNPSYAAFL